MAGKACVCKTFLRTLRYLLMTFINRFEICQSFDEGFDVRSVFLDISKTFEKVWYDGLIFKLKQDGIFGNLLNLVSNLLRNRRQRVVLNGQTSSWADNTTGVPQGSILRPVLFLIYINDLANGLSSNANLFADNTSLFSVYSKRIKL